MIKYGLLGYAPWDFLKINNIEFNIGDYIQSIAAKRFLPRVDFLVDREKLIVNMANLNKKDLNKIILNGWFLHTNNFPPNAVYSPLITSFHVTQDVRKYFKENLQIIEYLKKFQPIGCRDTDTKQFLESLGIDAFFSGCLTLTLPVREKKFTDEYIILNDLGEELNNYYIKKSKYPVLILCNYYYDETYDEELRFAMAEKFLNIIANAKCVITSRLHTALPALALNTNVGLVNIAPDQYRFSGLNNFVRNASVKDCLKGYFDINNMLNNTNDYLEYRNNLIKSVESFIAKN